MPMSANSLNSRNRHFRWTVIALIALLNLLFPQPALAEKGQSGLAPPETVECLHAPTVDTSPIVRLPDVGLRKAKRTIRVTVTAYSSTVDQTDGDPFTTASGTTVQDGVVAYNFLPFGTQVRFPDIFGEKIFLVEDRLNARSGPYHADIWMPSRGEALAWGKRIIRMEIL